MRWKRFHKDERGGAFAEAVIVLPAFILVWSLIIFVRDGYENAANSGVQVRQAAWAHSAAFCDGSPSVSVAEGSLWSGMASTAATILEGGRGWVDIVNYQPWTLSKADMVLIPPKLNNYSTSGTVSRPAALGGSASYGHQLPVTCDEEPIEHIIEGWIAVAYARIAIEVI